MGWEGVGVGKTNDMGSGVGWVEGEGVGWGCVEVQRRHAKEMFRWWKRRFKTRLRTSVTAVRPHNSQPGL